MAKPRSVWRCQQCGNVQPRWAGRCPECGEYGSYLEEAEATKSSRPSSSPGPRPVTLAEAGSAEDRRIGSGIPEFDRVLGGGLVLGSLVLIGGEPGVGKSTLLLQAAAAFASSGTKVLYASGEESAAQIGGRAHRLGMSGADVLLLAETDISRVEAAALERRPSLLVVDSIQTVADPDLPGAPGTVGQVRASAARLMRLAKDEGISTIVVGHVTKDGSIAGPRAVEHLVDAVLYFEGDTHHAFRVLRSVKNRFGPAGEVGIFEMDAGGLSGVGQPSGMLLAGRSSGVSGSAVLATIEGSRSLLAEVQALVTPTYLQVPRRLAVGIETGRLLQTLAVLERRTGRSFASHDVYVSVAGGVRLAEPAADLPLALALAGALSDVALPRGVVAFGEIGLTGEVRPVSRVSERLRESAAMGFTSAIGGAPERVEVPKDFALTRVLTVGEALARAGLDRGHGDCQSSVAQS